MVCARWLPRGEAVWPSIRAVVTPTPPRAARGVAAVFDLEVAPPPPRPQRRRVRAVSLERR